jgi:hypothetical protein
LLIEERVLTHRLGQLRRWVEGDEFRRLEAFTVLSGPAPK